MTSPNNMQSLALNNSEKEHSRNSTSNTDDEMPAITNDMYITELKEQIVDLKEQIANLQEQTANLQEQQTANLKEQIANLPKQHMLFASIPVFIVFLLAFLLAYAPHAKT
ncbi:hypothetical protein EAE99_005403 [Botrytis elliptica]|nr:hypothetical protein EAE99_005403 [Botrytis elliptica]